LGFPQNIRIFLLTRISKTTSKVKNLEALATFSRNKLTTTSGVKSLLFPNVCFVLSDLLLKWSEKDGFFSQPLSDIKSKAPFLKLIPYSRYALRQARKLAQPSVFPLSHLIPASA
jgi:hypothetical protein